MPDRERQFGEHRALDFRKLIILRRSQGRAYPKFHFGKQNTTWPPALEQSAYRSSSASWDAVHLPAADWDGDSVPSTNVRCKTYAAQSSRQGGRHVSAAAGLDSIFSPRTVRNKRRQVIDLAALFG